MACVCPDIEREIGRMMDFMTEVTGDALEAMQDAWDDRESFTREELGGAPAWAEYVDAGGELFSDDEMRSRYEDELNDLYGDATICGALFAAGSAMRELSPVTFRCWFNDWETERVVLGDLRRIEG